MKIDVFIPLYMTKISLSKIKQPTRTSNPKKNIVRNAKWMLKPKGKSLVYSHLDHATPPNGRDVCQNSLLFN